MAPAYKPLAVGAQEAVSIQDPFALQAAFEKQQAAQLQQEAQQMQLAETKRKLEQDAQLREALVSQFGSQEDGTTPTFDPNAALQTAQRLAAEQGDLDTMLNVSKAQRTLSGDRELTDVEATQLGVPLGTTLSVAKALQRSKDLQLEEDRFNDPLRVGNRTLDMTLKQQAATGTKIRGPNPGEIAPFGAADAATNLLDNIAERYFPYVEENRGIRYAEAKLNPNSAIARYADDLRIAAKNVALSMEARVTDQDYQIIADAAEPNDLDTMETLVDKNRRLKTYVENRTRTNLNAMEAGNVNVTGLRNRKRVDYYGNEIEPTDNGALMIPRVGAQQPGNASQPVGQTKVVGGVTYKKVAGGWEPQ